MSLELPTLHSCFKTVKTVLLLSEEMHYFRLSQPKQRNVPVMGSTAFVTDPFSHLILWTGTALEWRQLGWRGWKPQPEEGSSRKGMESATNPDPHLSWHQGPGFFIPPWFPLAARSKWSDRSLASGRRKVLCYTSPLPVLWKLRIYLPFQALGDYSEDS